MNDELTWFPAWRMRELTMKRNVSSPEVTDHFLSRIEKFDPILKAFKQGTDPHFGQGTQCRHRHALDGALRRQPTTRRSACDRREPLLIVIVSTMTCACTGYG